MTIPGHMTYAPECKNCQADWLTRRFGCKAYLPGQTLPTPICPECGAQDAFGHLVDCEFWYGSASSDRLAYRLGDTELPDDDDGPLGPRRSLIIGGFAIVFAVILLSMLPKLPYGTTTARALLAVLFLAGVVRLVGAIQRYRRKGR